MAALSTERDAKPAPVHTPAKIKRRWALWIWVAVFLLALLFAVRLWVGDVYKVVSTSMEPTLRKGDRVWVEHNTKDIERYDLVAFRVGDGRSVVKRVAAMPYDMVIIDGSGDLWIDGERPERPDMWVPIFDDRLARVTDHFRHGSEELDPWIEHEGYWEVDATGIRQGHSQGMLRHRDGVDNGQLLPSGKFRKGPESVGDIRLQFEFWIEEPGGILRIELTEESDVFQVLVDLKHLESGRAHLQRIPLVPESKAFMPSGFRLSEKKWIPVTFQNRDNVLQLWIGDQLVFDETYDLNRGHRLGSIGERVAFGATGNRVRFRSIRIDRDVTYSWRGTFAVGRQLILSADEYLLLGDNSQVSEDSRVLGPIQRRNLIGKVTHRVWPTGRFGGL